MNEQKLRTELFLADFGKAFVTLDGNSVSWEWKVQDSSQASFSGFSLNELLETCIQLLPLSYIRISDQIQRANEMNHQGYVSLDDVYGVESAGFGNLAGCSPEPIHRFSLLTFSRGPSSIWLPKKIAFGHRDSAVCQNWIRTIQSYLSAKTNRPKKLLVFVNPYSGNKQGYERWESVKPFFDVADIHSKVILTERRDHAFDLLNELGESELSSYDGVVVVGGDGLFNEVINGLLLSRTNAEKTPAEFPERSSRSQVKASSAVSGDRRIRLGLIPAGSTDTVLISITGSRDPITAALHIILGDRMALDIVKLTNWKQKGEAGQGTSLNENGPIVRFAASFCGYGFFGDVAKESENLRWMGPTRYDFAGFVTYMKHKSYEAKISYLETAEESAAQTEVNTKQSEDPICTTECTDCCIKSDSEEVSRPPGPQCSSSGVWRSVTGKFHSIGGAVMSCRNERAPDGLVMNAHLSDGLMHLIMIKECSRAEYLWQLIKLSQRGGDPFAFPFVRHHKTPAFEFESVGAESIWSVDGELFPCHKLSAVVCPSLVHMFARGPEH